MKLNCIAIDDDDSGLEMIQDYISNIPELQLLKKFTDLEEALTFLRSNPISDILFLDIELHKISALELFAEIKQMVKNVIFVTAHLKYIIDSYNNDVAGFLLKPYSFSKFEKVIKSITASTANHPNISDSEIDSIFIKVKGDKQRWMRIPICDIVAIEALKNYIAISTPEATIQTHLTITNICELLSKVTSVFRVHRSFLVSATYIREVNGNTLLMHRDIKVPLGAKYKDSLMFFLKTNLFFDQSKIK